MSRIAKKIVDIREIAPAVGAHFVFTGDIQYQEDNCRVNIQLIDADTNQQLWGEAYQRKFNPVNVFTLQDQIVRKVIAAVAKPHAIDEKPARISMATVA
jgi:TolB-like protein